MADPCSDFVKRIDELKLQRQALQEELKAAPPGEKPGLKKMIDELSAIIQEEKKKLANCREENPEPISPNIGIELFQCLPTQEIRDALESTVQGFVPKVPTTGHAQCIGGSERIGIWLGSPGSEAARRAALDQINLVKKGELFGIVAYQSLIYPNLKALWDLLPVTYNDDFQVDKGGRNKIQTAYVRFEPPDRILTVMEGTRKMPVLVPDIDFTVTITDTLSLNEGTVICTTNTSVETNSNLGEAIIISLLGGPVGLYIALVKLAADAVDGLLSFDSPEKGGFGGQLAATVFQNSIPLNNGISLIISYSRLTVSGGGFILGGGAVGVGNSVNGSVKLRTVFSNTTI